MLYTYTALHYATLHYTTLHYTTLLALRYALLTIRYTIFATHSTLHTVQYALYAAHNTLIWYDVICYDDIDIIGVGPWGVGLGARRSAGGAPAQCFAKDLETLLEDPVEKVRLQADRRRGGG